MALTAVVDAVSQTSRIENGPSITNVSSVVTPRKLISDDPPPEPGTKKRAHYLASFGLLTISLLLLIVGVGILRVFRQR